MAIFPLSLCAAITCTPPNGADTTTCGSHPCTIALTCATSPCATTELQTAITQSAGGDTITLEAGKAWQSRGNSLRFASGKTSLVTIRTSTADAFLPPDRQRITPAYAGRLATIQFDPTLSQLGTLLEAERTTNPSENYRFFGIQFLAPQGVDTVYAFVDVASDGNGFPPDSGNKKTWTTATGSNPMTVTIPAGTANITLGMVVVVYGKKGENAINGWYTVSAIRATEIDLMGTNESRLYSGVAAETLFINHSRLEDPSQSANNITFDRCLFIAHPFAPVGRGLRIGGRNITIQNSYISGVKGAGETQTIGMPQVIGPVLIDNNFLNGGTETTLTGGVIPALAGPHGTGQNASDLTITNNVYYQNPAFFKWEPWPAKTWVNKGKIVNVSGIGYIATKSGTTGGTIPTFPPSKCVSSFVCAGGCCVTDGDTEWTRTPLTNGNKWLFKNLMEFKNGERVISRYNTLDGAWVDGQTTITMLINCAMQGYVGLSRCQNFEFANNIARNTYQLLFITSGQDYGDGLMTDVNMHDNLYITPNVPASGSGVVNTSARGHVPPVFSGMQFNHNTVESTVSNSALFRVGTGVNKYENPIIRDNLMAMSGLPYPLICLTCPAVNNLNKSALDGMSVGSVYIFARNVLSGQNLSSWPTDNFTDPWASIGFTNTSIANYRLKNGSTYRMRGTDGRDLGVDTTQLPQIRNLTIFTTGTKALMSWQVNQPQAAIPCSIEVSSQRDYSDVIPDLNASTYTRPDSPNHDRWPQFGYGRSIVIGANSALTPVTTYWYRIHCGGAFEYGNFTTGELEVGTKTIKVSGKLPAGQTDLPVTHGATYSRATDTITGTTTTAVCAAGTVCTANFTAAAESILYSRIGTGPVSVRIVR